MRRRPSFNVVWPTRRDFLGCYVTVIPRDEDGIRIGIPGNPDDAGHACLLLDPVDKPPRTATLRLTRSEARLLARRLNQCLDATVKR